METVAEEKKPKKRLSKTKKTIVIILMLIVLLIVGFGLFTLIKLYGMSINAIKTVAKPTVSPYDTPDPGLVPADGDPDGLDRDVDESLDPNLIYADPIYVENAIDPDVVNILVMGDDTRGSDGGGRSDVMLIVSYNQRLHTIRTVSVLRDTWIYIPGRELWNRVNAAYRFGGIGLAINTINANFGLDIQYYMITDFENMKHIVDTLGGIDLLLTDAEISYYNERLEPGNKIVMGAGGICHLNGEQVLMHTRNRTLGNGDWSRTERQRAVMSALFARAKQEKSVASLTSLIYSLTDYVETNMTPWQMISIGTGVVFGNGGAPIKGTIPCEGSWSYAYERGMAVIHIDIEKNKEWIHTFFYGVR
jgi:LCP family protein required for cell wall assembly